MPKMIRHKITNKGVNCNNVKMNKEIKKTQTESNSNYNQIKIMV